MEPDRNEVRAAEQASARAGEYLEQIGKTDLATMTPEEWAGFLLHVHAAVADEIRAICDEQVPF